MGPAGSPPSDPQSASVLLASRGERLGRRDAAPRLSGGSPLPEALTGNENRLLRSSTPLSSRPRLALAAPGSPGRPAELLGLPRWALFRSRAGGGDPRPGSSPLTLARCRLAASQPNSDRGLDDAGPLGADRRGHRDRLPPQVGLLLPSAFRTATRITFEPGAAGDEVASSARRRIARYRGACRNADQDDSEQQNASSDTHEYPLYPEEPQLRRRLVEAANSCAIFVRIS
jgi:hypothetical protein